MSEAAPAGRRVPATVWIYAVAVLAALALAFTGRATDRGVFVLDGLVEGGIPFAFVLFVLVLLGVAFFHHQTMWVALAGVLVITAYTALAVPSFVGGGGAEHPGLLGHALHEGNHTLLNLGGLLLGFSLLAKFFEHSGVPENLPRLLPKRPMASSFVLLAIVWVLSSFLDNIAAAMIGGVMARAAFKGRVTVGYVAAIVASSNAGGAWSVLGDTTTTMMWIDKKNDVSPLDVFHGIVASAAALVVVGLICSAMQNRVQPIVPDPNLKKAPVDGAQLGIVALILAGAITTNFLLERPFVGVWAAIFLGALVRRPAWEEIPGAAKGALFLLSLVWCASLMPVETLPEPSWKTAFGLGFVSAVFDNIPLTKLALEQGGYDWGVLAFTVGFGGSMIWFGSSAGVAISKDFPEARNTGRYLKEGWPVALAYVVGFFAMLWTVGWHPHGKPHEAPAPAPLERSTPGN
jgi:Na+/H+ antiporter NhaD/arsenite permease-like protein